jgi:exopolysaccharide production protein ExoQ
VFSVLSPYSLHNRTEHEHGLAELKTFASGSSAGEEGHPERRLAVVGLALVALVLASRGRKHDPIASSDGIDKSVAFPVAAFVLFAAASWLWADDPALAARRIVVFLTACFAAWAVARAWRLEDILLFAILGCGGTLLVSFGLEVANGAFHPSDGSYRLSGLAHPNVHAIECAMVILSSLTAARLTPSHRRLYWAVAAGATVLLFFTRSRTAVLSVAAALACAAYFVMPRRKAVGIGVAIVAAALIIGVFVSNPLDSAKSVLLLGRQQSQADVGSMTGRVQLWRELLTYVALRPLSGYGFDSFWSPTHTTSVSVSVGWVVPHPHTGYLDMTLSLGVIGLALFCVVLVAALRYALRRLRIDRGDIEALYMFTLLVWVTVEMLAETILPQTHYGAFLVMVLLAREALTAPSAVPARAYVPVQRVAVSA